MGITGTYDDLVLPILLPKAVVRSLLPANLFPGETDPLLPVPSSTLEAWRLPVDEDGSSHPIILELGYQSGTGPGPWLLGMNFNEAKFEIPFVRHPSVDENDETPFVFKHTTLLSSRFLSLASTYMAGLRTSSATFSPERTPTNYDPSASSITYTVDNTLSAEFTLQSDSSSAQFEQGWNQVRKIIEGPWFGERTGETVTAFTFDVEKALVQPTPYTFELRLNMNAVKQAGESAEEEWTTAQGVAWRIKARFSSTQGKAAQFVKA